MKRICIAAVLVAATASSFATDVGVSVSVSQPGLYGRIDIGAVPTPPALIYPQPVVIAPAPVVVQQRPIYLHVPPGHAKDWKKHCGKYNACAQPVYFVQDTWYEQQYVPAQAKGRGQGGGGDHPGKGHGNGKGHGKKD